MKVKVLIVEDQFVEADHLRLMLQTAGYTVSGIAYSVAEARTLINADSPDLVLLDIFLKGKLTGIDLAADLNASGIPFVYLSANSNEEVLTRAKATQPYGFLVKPFREKDLLISMEIAKYRHDNILQLGIKKEQALTNEMLDALSSPKSRLERFTLFVKLLQPYIPFFMVHAGLHDPKLHREAAAIVLRIGFDEYQGIDSKNFMLSIGTENEDIRLKSSTGDGPEIFQEQSFAKLKHRYRLISKISKMYDVNTMLHFPVVLSDGQSFDFWFFSRRAGSFNQIHVDLLDRLFSRLKPAIRQWVGDANTRIGTTSKKNSAVPDEPADDFEGIIGKSELLLEVFDLVTRVAKSDTSVLILGESGTGKEAVADNIHRRSQRKNGPLVKINCAALPPTLIESELFGHERGAFTGATEQRPGKFELADKGTLFLDEIGEMPPELQVKLLRVLQERAIERVGSRTSIKVDVRIIAATNRNLEKEVAEGRFRLDLYYRLNVFPILLPPLRDRTEDIPALAQHFLQFYNRKAGRHITGFSDKALKRMAAYHWPGNIRELENLVERGVLLAKNDFIEDLFSTGVRKLNGLQSWEQGMKTIDENEKEHIMRVLRSCRGKIWGSGGAAELLQIPPTTLTSKMRKFGLKRVDFE